MVGEVGDLVVDLFVGGDVVFDLGDVDYFVGCVYDR